jgi:hypothetical protein
MSSRSFVIHHHLGGTRRIVIVQSVNSIGLHIGWQVTVPVEGTGIPATLFYPYVWFSSISFVVDEITFFSVVDILDPHRKPDTCCRTTQKGVVSNVIV